MNKRFLRCGASFGVLAIVVGLAGGCQTTGSSTSVQSTAVNYYPQCYAPVADLRKSNDDFNKTIVAGAALGALTGALIGGASTGSARGALIGGLTGAAAGGVLGYAYAKQQEVKDDNARFVSYQRDLNSSVSSLDRTTTYARAANTCYDREFHALIANVKRKTLSKDEAKNRFAEIQSGLGEVEQLMGRTVDGSKDKAEKFDATIKSESERNPALYSSFNRPQTAQATPAATPKKKKGKKPAQTEQAQSAPADQQQQAAPAQQEQPQTATSQPTTQQPSASILSAAERARQQQQNAKTLREQNNREFDLLMG